MSILYCKGEVRRLTRTLFRKFELYSTTLPDLAKGSLGPSMGSFEKRFASGNYFAVHHHKFKGLDDCFSKIPAEISQSEDTLLLIYSKSRAVVIMDSPKTNMEDKSAPPMDAFTIETLDDDHPANTSLEDVDHDQLPNVEEYKVNNGIETRGSKSKIICIAALAIIAIISLVVTGVLVASNKKEEDQPTELVGRIGIVQEFLFSNEVSTLPQLKQVGSPQQRAAAFVADGDSLRMRLNADNARRFVERYVLSLLYYHFEGTQWTYNLKFLSGRDHCEWFDDFQTEKGDIVRQGVICDENGLVKALNLGKKPTVHDEDESKDA